MILVVALLAVLAGTAYHPPVDAPVVDPFRAPACRWCPGNRGLEYATVPGQPVRASAGGEVRFAGQVAGASYVVVAHPDGLRTTYGHLARIGVQAGARVRAGAVVGVAGPRLHFGVRRGTVYLDPTGLFGGAPRVRLVPLGRPGRSRLAWPAGPALAAPPVHLTTLDPHAVAPRGAGRSATNRRKEHRSWRRSSPCGSCSRRGCTSGTRPAAGTRR